MRLEAIRSIIPISCRRYPKSYAKVWGERAKDKSQYLSQLHTDYYNKVGHKYGLARGFSYDELSEEEKRGRKHKNKVVLEAERQAKVALDKVEKYAVLATIDEKELTISFLNIKVPVQEAMNVVKKDLASNSYYQLSDKRRDVRSVWLISTQLSRLL